MQQIPLIDIREATPTSVLETHAGQARSLIAASRRSFGPLAHAASYAAAPAGDWLARRWLARTGNPYLPEIRDFARKLDVAGVYALNLVYEFGCTSGVYATDAGPRLLRVLDWPFQDLGRHTIVTRQRGPAGDFHNVTWPATSGVFSAMAEGRFAVALNQAPMRRHKSGLLLDWFKNRLMAGRANGLPPAHLLRKVCETAASYGEARKMLAQEPVCIPVIYILAGMREGEGCIIERLEESAAIRDMGANRSVYAANHFLSHLNGIGYGWRPREVDSCGRAVCAGIINAKEAGDPAMPWFKSPIANHNSRLCLSANPAEGTLSVMGTEGVAPTTELFRI
jgi:hypothetical protein